MNAIGIIIGVASFFTIGIFHPIVIKAEYYFSKRCWWCFLLVGLGCIALSLFLDNTVLSIIVSVVGFSSLWGIKELFEQERRVLRGWFPKNPNRKIPYPATFHDPRKKA